VGLVQRSGLTKESTNPIIRICSAQKTETRENQLKTEKRMRCNLEDVPEIKEGKRADVPKILKEKKKDSFLKNK